MDDSALIQLAVLFFLVAAFYASVGHAGASGYIAVMSLLGASALEIRPTALALNIVVGLIGLWRFSSAGLVNWRSVPPLVLASAPMAWMGARWKLPHGVHEYALAGVLLFSAVFLWIRAGQADAQDRMQDARVPWAGGLMAGATIGLISGITGTGGAIFLSPLLLFAHWAPTRQAAGIAIVFVWINSLFGLMGLWSAGFTLPSAFPLFGLAVVCGALLGTRLGIVALPVKVLRRVLAIVLLVAAIKLSFGG